MGSPISSAPRANFLLAEETDDVLTTAFNVFYFFGWRKNTSEENTKKFFCAILKSKQGGPANMRWLLHAPVAQYIFWDISIFNTLIERYFTLV